jgi:hypothetical protein
MFDAIKIWGGDKFRDGQGTGLLFLLLLFWGLTYTFSFLRAGFELTLPVGDW